MADYEAVIAGVTQLLTTIADAVPHGAWSATDRAQLVKSLQGLALQYYLLDEAPIRALPPGPRAAAVAAGDAALAAIAAVLAGQNHAPARRAAVAAARAAQRAYVALSPRAQAVAPLILKQMRIRPAPMD